MIRRWLIALRDTLDWHLGDKHLPDNWPEVGRARFDRMEKATGAFWLDMKFAPGTMPHEVAAGGLWAAAVHQFRRDTVRIALGHKAYRMRIRWRMDLEQLDPKDVAGPEFEPDVIIRNGTSRLGKAGGVLAFKR